MTRAETAERAQELLETEPARTDACRVELPQFEGPLDLLLHLITKHELDIIDIPIGFISERYLEYLGLMKNFSIDVASEYLVMAATLAHIKSKMLLPVPPSDQEEGLEEEPEDPRAELVRRLLSYQKYKAAAAELSERSRLGQDVFGKGAVETPEQGPAPLAQVGVFALIDAFNRIVERRKIKIEHEVDLDRISITERIGEISDLLRERLMCTLEELLPERVRQSDIIITFLALLEMTRLRMTRLTQSHPLAPLHIEVAVSEQQEPSNAPTNSDG